MKLIAKAQMVGDGFGNFRCRNLYEKNIDAPINARRVSVPLTKYCDENTEDTSDLLSYIKKNSVESTGIYIDGIDQTGFELFLNSQ